MARIAQQGDYQRINIGSSFNAPNAPAKITVAPTDVPYRAPGDYVGRAIGMAGSALGTLANGLQASFDEKQATADASWFSRARSQAQIDWLDTEAGLRNDYGAPVAAPGAGFSSPAGAGGPVPQGFADMAGGEWEKYRDQVMASAPSEAARVQFQQWADGFSVGVRQRASEFEEASLFAVRADDFNTSIDNHVKLVFQDPDRYDEVLAQADDDLAAAAAWMTPEQEVEARAKVEGALQLARAKKLAQFDPLRLQSEVGLANDAISIAASKIIGAESSGNPNAENPNSSAAGLGQFTDGTWLATIAKHRPDLAGRLSRSDLLALKTDPGLSREMTLALTRDNAAALAAAGLPGDEGSLYLAHFLGVGGARMILTATDDTPVAMILDPKAIAANPILQGGQTVGGLKAWAARKMGSATAADMGNFADNPKYSRLSPDQIFALAADANSAIIAQHNFAVAEQKAQYDARLNSLMVGILDGTAGLTDVQQARRDGWLADYGDIKKATDAIESRDKEQINIARAVSRLSDPNDRFNPFLEDDRADVNTAYKAMGGATALSSGDGTSIGRLTSFVDRTDIIPSDAVAALRAGMQSRDPAEMQASMTIMDGLYRAFPAAVSRPGVFAEEDIKRLLRWRALNQAGVPAETIVGAMNEANLDPGRVKIREEWRQEGHKLALETDPTEVLAIFNPGWWVESPGASLDSSIVQTMMDDYAAAFAEGFAINRDPEQAKDYAIEILTNPNARAWGLTDVGDDAGRVMKYPPEYYFNPVQGDHDWMGDQLEEIVGAEAGFNTIVHPQAGVVTNLGIKAQGWGVTAIPQTEAAISMGVLPKWMVHYIDETGMFHAIMPPPDAEPGWPFDYDAALAADRSQRAADRPIEIRRNRPDMPTDLPLPGAPGSGDIDYQKALQERLGQ